MQMHHVTKLQGHLSGNIQERVQMNVYLEDSKKEVEQLLANQANAFLPYRFKCGPSKKKDG